MRLALALVVLCGACESPPPAPPQRGIENVAPIVTKRAPAGEDDPFRRPEPQRRPAPRPMGRPSLAVAEPPAAQEDTPVEAPPPEEAPPTADDAPPVDVSAALAASLAGAAGCVPPSYSGSEVTANVSAMVSATGRVTRAEVSAPSPEIAECLRRRALAARVTGPIPGAPLLVVVPLTFRR